jgi:hypothetical protein
MYVKLSYLNNYGIIYIFILLVLVILDLICINVQQNSIWGSYTHDHAWVNAHNIIYVVIQTERAYLGNSFCLTKRRICLCGGWFLELIMHMQKVVGSFHMLSVDSMDGGQDYGEHHMVEAS